MKSIVNNKKLILIIVLSTVFGLTSCSAPEKYRKLYPDVSIKRVANSKPQVLAGKRRPQYRSAVYSKQANRDSIRLKQLFKVYGKQAKKRIQDWQHTIIDYQRGSEIEKLNVANRFINRLNFVDDKIHWQKKDYWATPMETLASSGGDCEDLAIAKYYTLTKLGIPDQCLTLNYVKVKNYNKPHMVLVYQCLNQDEALVLDNLNPQLLSVKQRKDLVSVYSFNQSGMWFTNKLREKHQLSHLSRLRLWDDVRLRIKQQNL